MHSLTPKLRPFFTVDASIKPDRPKKITIQIIDITELPVDIIVNAANHTLLGGGGVDGAIHQAAGPELLEACRALNGCLIGFAKITPAFNLPAKFVVHAAGPRWDEKSSGAAATNSYLLLQSAYRQAFAVAEPHAPRTMSFPAISTGIYKFPKDTAAEIALLSIADGMNKIDNLNRVFVCLFDDENHTIYNQVAHKLFGPHKITAV